MNILNVLKPYADVLENESLTKHTTFRIGGVCDYFIYPKSILCLMRILRLLQERHIPYAIFGKGSNLLCSDEPYHGAVICLDRYLNNFYFEEDGTLIAEAGCSIILLAQEAMRRSLSGLEFASGIPGTLGGAMYMNAGAYKSDISACLKEVCVCRDHTLVWMKKEELDYAYRHSAFQSHPEWTIIAGKLQLSKSCQKEIRSLMDARRERRLSSQPLDLPNCGGAMVSDKHANFIVNVGSAKAKDVDQLIQEIQEKISEQYGIDLITEVERFNWNS